MSLSESTLRGRCSAFIGYTPNSISVEALAAFVVSEIGRTSDDRLNEALPLCLYFATEEDREGFISDFLQAKPNVITRKIP